MIRSRLRLWTKRTGSTGSRRLEEQALEDPQIHDVHQTGTVQVDLGIGSKERVFEDPQVNDIDQTAVIKIRITNVTMTVAIGVLLAGIGHRDTVIDTVIDTVTVGVDCVSMECSHAKHFEKDQCRKKCAISHKEMVEYSLYKTGVDTVNVNAR